MKREEPKFIYTARAREMYGPTYLNRPHIGRDSRVKGGVYYGWSGKEAVVVDDDGSNKEQYDKLYAAALKIAPQRSKDREVDLVRAAFHAVRGSMKYSLRGVDKIAQDRNVPEGGKINLAVYLGTGTGICRHMALAVGYVLERMVDEGLLQGQVSVDRSVIGKEGHAWGRYTTRDGLVLIIDPAGGMMAPLDKANIRGHWDYLRDGEVPAKSNMLARWFLGENEPRRIDEYRSTPDDVAKAKAASGVLAKETVRHFLNGGGDLKGNPVVQKAVYEAVRAWQAVDESTLRQELGVHGNRVDIDLAPSAAAHIYAGTMTIEHDRGAAGASGRDALLQQWRENIAASALPPQRGPSPQRGFAPVGPDL